MGATAGAGAGVGAGVGVGVGGVEGVIRKGVRGRKERQRGKGTPGGKELDGTVEGGEAVRGFEVLSGARGLFYFFDLQIENTLEECRLV